MVAAELDKLRTLPLAILAVLGTSVAGLLIAGVLAAAAADQGTVVSAVDLALRTAPFVVAGIVLVGVAPVAQEHAGRQVLTSMAAVPRRGLLVAGKTAAAAVVVVLTALATIGAAVGGAAATQLLLDAPAAPGGPGWGSLLGAAAYLALVGMLTHAVALVVRHLVPALVGMLSLVVVVSPLLAGVTEHARWLPDRAAMAWFEDAPGALEAPVATAVALAWLVLVGAAGTLRTLRSDALAS
ncbi:hypothetical protein [Oerskovia turbata]